MGSSFPPSRAGSRLRVPPGEESYVLRRVWLHVVFIGCFALMVLTVSVHVVLSHAGAGDLLRRSGWQLRTVAVLLFAALFSRMMVDFDMAHVRLWLGIAAGTFLASTLVWLQLSFRRHLQP